MKAKDVILSMIDRSGPFALRVREIANETNVNAGQLSHWLNKAGPLSSDNEGRIAEYCLKILLDYVGKMNLRPEALVEIQQQIATLQSYDPYRRRLAALPETAERGEPISRQNPRYIRRGADVDLEDELRKNHVMAVIIGEAKTGKSTLLLSAQTLLESSRTVLRIDLANCDVKTPVGGAARIYEFLRWIAWGCEEQCGKGCFPVCWSKPDDCGNWAMQNIVFSSLNNRAILLLDHLESLDADLAEALDDSLMSLVKYVRENPYIKTRFSVIAAATPDLENSWRWIRWASKIVTSPI